MTRSAISYAIADGAPGWHLITPLTTAERRRRAGRSRLRARRDEGTGVAAAEARSKARRQRDRTGAAPETQGTFTPDTDPDAQSLVLPRSRRHGALHVPRRQPPNLAPFFLEAEKSDVPGGWPRGGQTRLDLPNNHLQYALTWFLLALCLVVIYAVYVRPGVASAETLRNTPSCGGRPWAARFMPEILVRAVRGSDLRYVSTRGEAQALLFEDALLAGLARDGGLYLPEAWPQVSRRGEIAALAGRDYADAAYRVMRPYLEGDPSLADLEHVLDDAYGSFHHPAVAPLRQIAPTTCLLELFHGPTLAFKDLAMQVVARLMNRALHRRGARATVIGATSGDTGAAAIEAFRGLDAIDIFILHPKGRVSDVQRRQMTTASERNVHNIAIEGTFDDCQAIVKSLFNDAALRDRLRADRHQLHQLGPHPRPDRLLLHRRRGPRRARPRRRLHRAHRKFR